jgi:chromate transport protein ChrA
MPIQPREDAPGTGLDDQAPSASRRALVLYFLRLGALGFGGPAALVGYMRRDLVERRKVVAEDTYNLALALAQIMPGPLAAQTAMAIGYFALIWLLERSLLTTDAGAAGDNQLLQILLFFTKAGAFVFGSGLAIVPFLQEGVVHQLGWLTEHEFLDAVAVALITPGPVVITVAFIGYLVAGLPGATLAAVGIFLPVYFFTILPAPWFARHRENLQLKAFVAGTTAAASGAIAGAVVVLGRRAIIDVPTAAVALVALFLLWRFRIQEPLIVLGAGAAGLLLWPLRG